jgi:transcriptional regulator with XRE-family HTH domain
MPKRRLHTPRQRTPTPATELQATAKKRGEDLRQEAARRNVAQHELAQQLNVSQATISRYLRGAILHPTHELVERIRAWYGQRDVWPVDPAGAAPTLTWEQIEIDPQAEARHSRFARKSAELTSDQRLRWYQAHTVPCPRSPRRIAGGAGQFCIVKKTAM